MNKIKVPVEERLYAAIRRVLDDYDALLQEPCEHIVSVYHDALYPDLGDRSFEDYLEFVASVRSVARSVQQEPLRVIVDDGEVVGQCRYVGGQRGCRIADMRTGELLDELQRRDEREPDAKDPKD